MATTVGELIEELKRKNPNHTVTIILEEPRDSGQMVCSGDLGIEDSDMGEDEVIITGRAD